MKSWNSFAELYLTAQSMPSSLLISFDEYYIWCFIMMRFFYRSLFLSSLKLTDFKSSSILISWHSRLLGIWSLCFYMNWPKAFIKSSPRTLFDFLPNVFDKTFETFGLESFRFSFMFFSWTGMTFLLEFKLGFLSRGSAFSFSKLILCLYSESFISFLRSFT